MRSTVHGPHVRKGCRAEGLGERFELADIDVGKNKDPGKTAAGTRVHPV